MKIVLNTPVRRITIAAAVVVLALLYAAAVTREFAANWFGGRAQLASLQWAVRLDGSNAEYRNHLGRYYDLVARDPAAALGYYRQAVDLNPHSARFWFDLAGAYQVLGDTISQTAALERAIQADAMTPDVAWEAANLYLVQGQNEKAMREFRVVMANDASLTPNALQFCWRINPDVDALLRDVVPPKADAYVAFLSLLEVKGEISGTFKVWNALIHTGQSFELRQVFDYIHFLILNKEVDQAELVWQQAAPRFRLTSYLPSASNLIVNPTFNLDILNSGFDWQYQKQSSVTLTLDPGDFHAGQRSLQITLDGPGINDAGFYQFVVVQPKTTYQFSGYYKNEDMEGAGGMHFLIQDMYSQRVYYESDELKDASFWKSADGEFTTGADCKLIVLHVQRLPAGSPIRGKLWVDDFHLTKKPS